MSSIVIVKPNTKNNQYGVLKELSAIEPPIWQAIFANYYKADILIDAEFLDLDFIETLAEILKYKPKKVIILATGSHPSAYIQQKQEAIKLETYLTNKVSEILNLGHLPISPCKWTPPKWDLLAQNIFKYKAHNWHSWGYDFRTPYGVVFTSISCPFHCNFCTVHNFYGNQFEQRILEDVLYDFGTWYNLGITHIKIMDELFIFNPNRVHLICDKLIDRKYNFNIWAYARIDIMNEELLAKMKKAGINWLSYGIESGNENIRKKELKGNFNNNRIREVIKMTKKAGINCLGNYMFGFWEDDIKTMQETLSFAKELKCEYSNFYSVTSYPGTKHYKEMIKKGVSLPTDYNDYAQMSPTFKPLSTKYLQAKEVLKFRDDAFSSYFTDSSYLQMMKEKFGEKVVKEIKEMTDIKIQRI
jgi:radical SAM superfamily enzyme YgiQ (UPF0313 family)